jgi:AbrB family looped-hinge helix DNA binding protein
MNNTVKLSSKGQLVIPAEIRRSLSLTAGTELNIALKDGQIVIEKLPPTTEWDAILSGIPVEDVEFDANDHFDKNKNADFDAWMKEG